MNGVSFPRLQRIDYRFKWVKEASRRNSCLEDSSGQMQVPYVVYNPWHKNRVALYTACIRVHCTNVLIGWSVVKSTAAAAMPIVGPVVQDPTGSKHPRKSDSSMIGPSNGSRRIKFQKWIK